MKVPDLELRYLADVIVFFNIVCPDVFDIDLLAVMGIRRCVLKTGSTVNVPIPLIGIHAFLIPQPEMPRVTASIAALAWSLLIPANWLISKIRLCLFTTEIFLASDIIKSFNIFESKSQARET